MEKIFIGIDVSKANFEICVKDRRNEILMDEKKYPHTKAGFSAFEEDLNPYRNYPKDEIKFGLESTGVYHKSLEQYIKQSGYPLRVFNPLEVAKEARRRIRNTKTDRIDAAVIAETLIIDSNKYNENKTTTEQKRLKEYGRLRKRLMKKFTKCKIQTVRTLDILCRGYDNLFTDCLSPSSVAVFKLAFRKTRFLDVSEKDLEKVLASYHTRSNEAEVKAKKLKSLFLNTEVSEELKDSSLTELHMLIQQHDLLKEQIQRVEKKIKKESKKLDTKITSIPGVGDILGGIILGEIGDWNRFSDGAAIVAFAGLDPVVHQSGKSRHTGHISKRGSPVLREALYLAARSAARCNPVCKQFYKRLRARGKHYTVCLVAVARKLLLIIYSVLKNNREFYVPKYVLNTE